jgi:hypothetical protein
MQLTHDTEKRRQQAFKEAAESLISGGYVGYVHSYVWNKIVPVSGDHPPGEDTVESDQGDLDDAHMLARSALSAYKRMAMSGWEEKAEAVLADS